MVNQQKKTFSAFISYSHQDRDTVAWLHRFLCRFWVPGKPRRNIFRDEYSLAAGPLTENLRDALRNSQYLIVCCSPSSRGSSYVDLEIREFLAEHPPERVLVCRVGEAEAGPFMVPEALAELERQRGDTLLVPNLQGFSKDLSRSQKADYEQVALSLLAPLVGLKDKGVLLDRRRKIRRVAVALLGLALLGIGGWQAWTYTNRYQVQAIARDCCGGEEFKAGAFGPLSGTVISAVAEAGRWADADQLARRIREKLTRTQTLTSLAETFDRAGRHGEATSVALAALATARSIDDPKSRAEALMDLTHPLCIMAPSQEAVAVQEAFQASMVVGAPEVRSFLCSRSAAGLIESGRSPEEVRRALAEALKAAQRIGDPGFQARAYASAVKPLVLAQKSEETDRAEEAAISAARRVGASEDRAITLAKVAIILADARLASANRVADEAIEAAGKVGRRELRAFVLSNLTDLFASVEPGDSPHAILPEKALLAARAIERPGMRAKPLAIASAALSRAGKPREASEAAIEAMKSVEQLQDDPDDCFQVAAEVADLLKASGPREEARSSSERALSLARSLPEEAERPVSLMKTAAALTVFGRKNAAKGLAQRALRAAATLPDERDVSDLQLRMAELEALWGEYRKARLRALQCRVSADRLKAFTAILHALAKAESKPGGLREDSSPVPER